MTKLYAAKRAAEQFGAVEAAHEERRDAAATKFRDSRSRWVARALMASDLIAVSIAALSLGPFTANDGGTTQAFWSALVPLAWLLLFAAYGLYSREGRRVSHSTLDELPRVVQACLLGSVIVFGVHELVGGGMRGVGPLASFAAVTAALVLGLRLVARATGRRLLQPERALLVTDAPMSELIARKLSSHPEYGLEPVGLLAAPGAGTESPGLPVLGDLSDLADVAANHDIGRIVLGGRYLDQHDELRLLRHCRELELKVAFVPHPFEALGQSVEVDDIEGITVLAVNPPVLSFTSRVLKRTLDVVGALVGMVLFSPLMVLTTIAIKVDSRGPVLFRQSRVGRQGKTFHLLKFRSMFTDAEELVDELRSRSKDPHWLHIEHDPRITRVGLWLRLMSLDELPQLWNVLKGEMSLVGPRPLIASEDELILGHERARLKLLPGITGSWQVLGRTTIPFEEMVSLDYLYVVNWSLWGDLKLIFRTIPVVLRRSGAN
jgi:exopolysaccharide biosynthesis polyprenyl glycosylphosphotransferase